MTVLFRPKTFVQVQDVFPESHPVDFLRDAVDARRRVRALPVEALLQQLRRDVMGQRMEYGGRLPFRPLGYLRQFRRHGGPVPCLVHVSPLKFISIQAAFADSGSAPVPRPFPGVFLPFREDCATTPPSDAHASVGRDYGRPSSSAYHERHSRFRHTLRRNADRA